jgi:hypothetical protein
MSSKTNILDYSNILVLANDAGGAEVLSSYLKTIDANFTFKLTGPAVKVFDSKGLQTNTPIKDLKEYDLVLASTSWKSDLELNYIKDAKELGIKTISFLDHWCNYLERYTRDNQSYLPEEIWVTDKFALKIAEEIFQDIPIYNNDNYYLKEIEANLEDIESRVSKNNGRVLYVCEPLSEVAKKFHNDENYWGYTEFDSLKFFLSNIDELNLNYSEIVIRLHPSESRDKHNWCISEYPNLPIKISSEDTLLDDIVRSDVVVGCESMALVVAMTANKNVISTIPHSGRECLLPHTNLKHLRNIISN